jgi:hypothetical protein
MPTGTLPAAGAAAAAVGLVGAAVGCAGPPQPNRAVEIIVKTTISAAIRMNGDFICVPPFG